jgi:hypothetical protein
VSVADERATLEPTTLLEHVAALQFAHPDGRLPDRGRPYPDEDHFTTLPSSDGTFVERKQHLIDLVLSVCQTEPSPSRARFRMADALASLRIEPRFAAPLADGTASLDPKWRQRVGRHLAFNSHERGKVVIGLALLAGVAGPSETSGVRLLGLLSHNYGEIAIRVLSQIPGAAPDIVWLADRSDPLRHTRAVEALCSIADPATFGWLLRESVKPDTPSVTCARQVAETIGLADLIAVDGIGDDVVEQAGQVLAAMTMRGASGAELRKYGQAQAAVFRFAHAAATMRPTFDRYAVLVSLLSDLYAGQAATFDWPDGEGDQVRGILHEILDSRSWTDVLTQAEQSTDPQLSTRARWARQVQTLNRETPLVKPTMNDTHSAISIRVAVPDPKHGDTVETKIFIDGQPIITEAFSTGPAEAPETLLGPDHRLHASAEPREVRLAEAECTEGCCGALYVTIERHGNDVIWRDWRNPDKPGRDMPTFRFHAAQYDTEVARAENDHSWEWPDRTIARLLRERLHAAPDILGQWNCHAGWAAARPNDRGRVHLSYFYPRRPGPGNEPWLQFVAVIDIPDCAPAPEHVAEEILRELSQKDPRQQRWLAGGSGAAAHELGFDWPERR